MRRIKIFTIIDRLNWFSDIWIKYHLKYFKKEQLAFINDKIFLSDEELKNYLIEKFEYKDDEINIIHSSEQPKDLAQRHTFMTQFLNNTQSILLKENDVVIYLDIDELIYHAELLNILQTFEQDYIVTNSMDITHNINFEDDFDFSRPINLQRNFINTSITSNWYRKPIITRKEIQWTDGRHAIAGNLKLKITFQELFIIHLGKIDLKFTNYLNKQNKEMRGWVESHNTLIDQQIESYFRQFTFSRIPEYIKVALNDL